MTRALPYLLMTLAFLAARNCCTRLIRWDAWTVLGYVALKDAIVIWVTVVLFRAGRRAATPQLLNLSTMAMYCVLVTSFICDWSIATLKG